MENFPFVHKHPLYPEGKLVDQCCVCERINDMEECFICKECKFYFCNECAIYAREPEMRKLHNRHLLIPTKRNFWQCDLCRGDTYSSGISMCCEQCNFDVCVNCFWRLKERFKEEKIY